MKLERGEPMFKPVIITLDSLDEIKSLYYELTKNYYHNTKLVEFLRNVMKEYNA